MATKTTINLDDEALAALNELVAFDGTMTLAIKRSLLAQAERRRRNRDLLDFINEREASDGPIDPHHIAWADKVLDRQGIPR